MEKMYLIDAEHLVNMVGVGSDILREVGNFTRSHDPSSFDPTAAKDIGHIIYAVEKLREASVEAMKMLAKQGHPLMKDTFALARDIGILRPEDDYEG